METEMLKMNYVRRLSRMNICILFAIFANNNFSETHALSFPFCFPNSQKLASEGRGLVEKIGETFDEGKTRMRTNPRGIKSQRKDLYENILNVGTFLIGVNYGTQ